MSHGLAVISATYFLLQFGQDPAAKPPAKESGKDQASSAGKVDPDHKVSQKKTGRPGELTQEEEDKIDQIIREFIMHDLGVRPSQKAVDRLRDLGPEAIPALVRGINYSATLSHSCPVTVLASKLDGLIRTCEDPFVLSFIRTEIGAGLKRNKYAGLLTKLKVQTSLRATELQRLQQEAWKKDPNRSLGDSFGKPGNQDQ